jgi:M6 family metalloprotease-like protein
MKKITNGIYLILTFLYTTLCFAQISPKEGVNPPADFWEFQQLIESEYSNGYYAEKFRERKQIREQISRGLLPESTLVEDTVFALTLMGQYPDLPGHYTQQEFQSQLYDGPNPTGTVTEYYSEVSYNQLYFTGDAQGWYDVPGNLQSYIGGYGGPQFVVDVIEETDPTLNYADYIQYYDGQGKPHIGFVAVVHAGAGAEAGANNIWSHRWTFTVIRPPYITNDIDPVSGQNVIIDGPYAIMPERSGGGNTSGPLIEIGVFAHEFGHIFGIPDLYDTDGSSSGVGEWCLMASGSWGGDGSSPETPTHMSAWVKKELGWVTPINIISLEEALLVPNVEENPIVYRMWGSGTITNQYFLIENRQNIGFDTNIHNSGFLIYHVDDTQDNNRNEDHYKVDVEQADGLRGLNNGTNRGDAGDPFPGSTNNTRFDWNTNPDSKDYNLINTFVSLRNIEEIGNTMIGDFEIQSGAYLFTETETILFEMAFGDPPLAKIVTIANYGFEDLIINNITSQVGPFTLLSNPSPVTLATDDSLNLEIHFDPSDLEFYSGLMSFDDNDPGFEGLTLNGQAYIINPAYADVLYASTGVVENGKILTVDRNSGAGNEVGLSNYEELSSLTIEPVSNVLYGISSDDSETELVKINALDGDAFTQYVLDIGSMNGIAFDASGTLYGATLSGDIYTIDLSNGSYTLITTANISLAAITINPLTNQLWAARKAVIGAKDRIYTIDMTTGEGTLLGQTGFGVTTNDLAFDENGTFYGIIGEANEGGQLITISTADGSGTLVGDIGFQNVVGLAYTITGDPNSAGDEISATLPTDFILEQNYPNPFNPSTSIEFSVPVNSDVAIKIYNLLGQVVTTLVNEEIITGHHSLVWKGNDESGNQVTSGIYFYEMKANGSDGRAYSQIRKMVLLK